MIKAFIVEDTPRDCQTLREMLAKTKLRVNVAGSSAGIDEAFAAITKLKPDLVFLDIELGAGETGFDLLNKFSSPDFGVIFTTAFGTSTNAISAIRVCALDFITKPLYLPDLDNALERYITDVSKKNRLKSLSENEKATNEIWIKGTDGHTQISIHNVLYCESDNYTTSFYLNNPVRQKYMYLSTTAIGEWEKDLKHTDILRVHNEFLANIKYIEVYRDKADNGEIRMNDGKIIPVSKSRKKEVKERIRIFKKRR